MMIDEVIDSRLVSYSVRDILSSNNKWFRVRTLTGIIYKQHNSHINRRKLAIRISIAVNNLVANDHVIREKRGSTYQYKWKFNNG